MKAIKKILENNYGLKVSEVRKLDIDSTNELYYVKADRDYFLKRLFPYPTIRVSRQ